MKDLLNIEWQLEIEKNTLVSLSRILKHVSNYKTYPQNTYLRRVLFRHTHNFIVSSCKEFVHSVRFSMYCLNGTASTVIQLLCPMNVNLYKPN